MKKANFFVLFGLFLTQFFAASAQESSLMKGAEKAAFQKELQNGKCFVFGKYIVKTVAGEDVGEEIKIYRNNSLSRFSINFKNE